VQCACRWSSHCGRRARRAVIVNDCEYHSPTSIVCSVPKMLLPAGACLLSASNDGSDFGFGVEFRLFDDASLTPGVVSNEQRVTILRSQLQNVQRAIVNIQRMEEELRQQLQMVDMPLSASTFGALVPAAAAAGGAATGGGLSESTAQAPAATIADMWDSIVHSLEEHDDREIRIFVSSPFRDMQEERDQFVRWNRAPTIDRWPEPNTNNCTRQCVCVPTGEARDASIAQDLQRARRGVALRRSSLGRDRQAERASHHVAHVPARVGAVQSLCRLLRRAIRLVHRAGGKHSRTQRSSQAIVRCRGSRVPMDQLSS